MNKAKVMEVLKRVEWVSVCPWCHGWEGEGHRGDCKLDALLNKEREAAVSRDEAEADYMRALETLEVAAHNVWSQSKVRHHKSRWETQTMRELGRALADVDEARAAAKELGPDYLATCKFLSIEEALVDYEAATGIKISLGDLTEETEDE